MKKEPKKFIIIDDDPLSNFICRKSIHFATQSSEIIEFTDAQRGLEYIIKTYSKDIINPPTLLLLDINMPLMNGWEFLEKLRQLQKNITDALTIFIISSSVSSADRERALSYPEVSGYIIKPFRYEALEELSKQGN